LHQRLLPPLSLVTRVLVHVLLLPLPRSNLCVILPLPLHFALPQLLPSVVVAVAAVVIKSTKINNIKPKNREKSKKRLIIFEIIAIL